MASVTFSFANNSLENTSISIKAVETVETENCRTLGDVVYEEARNTGATHRQARRARRTFIIGCNANQQ